MLARLASLTAAALLLAGIAASPGGHPATASAPTGQDRPVSDVLTRHSRPAVQAAQITTVVQPGDTYGRWAVVHCGSFTAWRGIQDLNRWPERGIPVGATAVIACQPASPAPAKPAHTDSPAPARVTAAWVHPLASGRTGTSCFHTRARPSHNGVDMPQPKGTPIRAAAAGTVVRKAYQDGGAGYYLTIAHAGGVFTQYHHLRAPSPLTVGAVVGAGQTIGYVGETGNATGPHLHFEVHQGRVGAAVNPAAFMRARGVSIGC